jgi:hypothetical protein
LKVVLVDVAGVSAPLRYDRDARVVPLMWFCGEVGDGILGDGYPGDVDWLFPFMAARCDEDMTARSAALDGSRVCSAIDLSCTGCVGDVFLGVAPIRIFL